jgi:hypothetical protein
MSVYHKWRTVFVQIPKNASSAIHRIMENQTDHTHDHSKYVDIISWHDPELIESYYSFAICRNPYDRLVSAYEFLQQGEWDLKHLSFKELVEYFYEKGNFFYTEQDVFFWPQHRFVTIKKIILVDDIVRYETLDAEWPTIQAKIMANVPSRFAALPIELKRENPSHNKVGKNWEEYYTPELKKMVYELYERDFEIFKYEK